MKKSDVLILLLIIAFDILFYKQVPGINLVIFSFLLLIFSTIEEPEIISDKRWILTAFVTLFSSALVSIYSNFYSVLSYLISLSLLAAYTAKEKAGIWTAFSGMIFTYLISPFIFFRKIKQRLQLWRNIKNQHHAKILIVAVTFLIVLAFFFIYRKSSLLFYNLTQKINLDFITFILIIFTINALLLIIAFKNYSPLKKLQSLLDKPGKTIEWRTTLSEEEVKKVSLEQFACTLLLSLLNALLIIVNILDLNYLINRLLPDNVSYADFLHQGIGMLILSIILAVSVILYFFRKELNFSNNKWLKILAYTWVVQNLFMILSNVSRNSMYIEAYGLTEKRIGVYFYLLLSAMGLVTTLIKIYKKQTNAYLIRATSMAFFAVLLCSCIVNWSAIITRHDLARTDADKNFSYLVSLSYTNIPQLLDYAEKHKLSMNTPEWQYRVELLHGKMLKFINRYNKNSHWQSTSYMRNKIYKEIFKKKVNTIFLHYANDNLFEAISYFPNVETLVLRNSWVEHSTEWSKLKKLKRLTLTECGSTDLWFLYRLNQLEYLDLSGCQITDFKPLYSLKSLKELYINLDETNLRLVKMMMPQTKVESKLINKNPQAVVIPKVF